jgi:hypothetical protein
MYKGRRFYLAINLLLVSLGLFAQETGMPFIRNYPSEDFRANQQNWACRLPGISLFTNTMARSTMKLKKGKTALPNSPFSCLFLILKMPVDNLKK